MAEEKKKRGSTTDIVRGIAQPLAAELGLTLWDVTFTKEGAEWYLRIFIDKEGGVSINDCENISRKLDPLLDEADPIEESYYLEVSSPGIERELKCDMHVQACAGERVEVKLYAPRDGAKSFVGVLLGLDGEGNIVVEADGKQITFDKKEIAKIQTVFDF